MFGRRRPHLTSSTPRVYTSLSSMCDDSTTSRRSVDNLSDAMPAPGMGRRQSFMSLLKGGAAIVVGEAILTDLAEAGAARAAATLGAEEVAEVAGAGAAAEGVAALRNGKVVLGEMERRIFGSSIHL